MKDLCTNLILGLDFQSQHESVTYEFGDVKKPLVISAFTILKTKLPSLFQNLTENSRAVASNSRHYSDNDKKFIASEVGHL